MTKSSGRFPNAFVSPARGRRRRVYSNPPADVFLAAIMPYIVGAIALYFVTRKAQSELPKKAAEVAKAAGEIKTGLPGFLADKIFGRDASTYITQAEADKRAKALLELNRAKAAVAGFSPVVYGS